MIQKYLVGFILFVRFIGVEGREYIFVHFSDIAGDGFKTLRQDDEVEFEIETVDGKERTTNVVVK